MKASGEKQGTPKKEKDSFKMQTNCMEKKAWYSVKEVPLADMLDALMCQQLSCSFEEFFL